MASKPRTYRIQVQPGSDKTVSVAVKNALTSHTHRAVTLAIQEAYAMGGEDRDASRQEAYEAGIALGQATSEKQHAPGPNHGDHFGE